ncbi:MULTISPECIES: pectin acetylesterase-family hydrolase [unclassified Aureispira]|uniref:pectin acetylesterase-family hydrolase n=1 Tax=unclassified Aureispira TaxID=2649989 RepID=UPI000697857F|nr:MULTISPECIES: pectin acetylesterase-family hydrolase [unclassified Aureispira]WMX12064.1 pectin acetylesterase-family hydrolase [Aureispira sp. CCB-E]
MLRYLFVITLVFLTALSCEKEKTLQEEFEEAAEKETWHFIPIPGMICRDNSNTGIGVRLKNNSNKVIIYLEGGGGCFNAVTCVANPSAFGQISFDSWQTVGLQFGIFDKGSSYNPFKDWNYIYIPYCTGDVHSGTSYNSYVNIVHQDQKMVGHNNITLALEALKTYFGTRLDEVFLTGSSAGGYGTLINANQVIEAFPNATATVLDDSGPVLMDQNVQPDCLDDLWQGIFHTHIPDDFADYTSGQYSTSMKSIYEYLSNKHPNVQFGLISALEDIVIREFYGYGVNNCAESTVVPAPLPAIDYKNALIYLRDSVFSRHTNWKTFYVNDASHTFNLLPGTMQKEVNGVQYGQWINALRNRTATHVYE